jgi:hypothetical protein
METNQVTEHLQVIRTLMERSALYRRALAPIMTLVGAIGTAASALGWFLKIAHPRAFILFWAGAAVLALIGAFLLVRQQALKDAEPFWSPPTRRTVEAITPSLFFGGVVAVVMFELYGGYVQLLLPPIWMALYGCALHAAGFFMPRGIKWLGWLFIAFGCGLLLLACADQSLFGYEPEGGHLAMGAIFGVLHLAYGIYLYFTEHRKTSL